MEELEAEVRELREKAEHIKREIGDRNPEQAPDMHHALREIHGRMEEIQQHFREGERDRPRHDVEARIGELKRHHAELAERAEAIEREMGQLRDGQEIAAGAEGRREAPVPEEFRRRLDELKRKITELSAAGRHDEAERLKREGRQMMERFQAAQRERPRPDQPRPDQPRPDQPRPEGADELQRRIEHVKAAIENLRAAGLHEPAERLAEQMERAIREHRERFGDRPDRPHPAEHPDRPRPEHPEAIPHIQEQINQMRREMEEMRQLLKELVQQQRER